MRRGALPLAGLALLLTACGGATGVRDEGKTPMVPDATHVVKLWFIRPGGRVGIEGDLVPVNRHFRADRNHLSRSVVMRALAQGPSRQETLAGFRTVLGCCDWTVNNQGSTVAVRGGSLGGFRSIGETDVAPWIELAGAAQIQRTLAALPGVRHVVVWGLSQRTVHSYLRAQGDPGVTAPTVRGSCAAARARPAPISVTAVLDSRARQVLRVSAAITVSIQFSSLQYGEFSQIVAATVAPCGIVDVTFPPLWPRNAQTDTATRFEVLVSPTARSSAFTGVTKTFQAFTPPTFP